ncbi:hypothetical protein HYH03_000180 [Edaphochlamys debaryana]|uniref:Uncharacterized protein n=1 Tax=Edaphochlamys debaryana TaxID=47281 RepID=A0A835YF02_9CHLO|nr:hypothetical protein HYH03_000180 [Edaphochlamys debaryana]|eukprot:KAG2501677.1 hypothetical protein HYH03_000180 [Edaphochlamys debaryana]
MAAKVVIAIVPGNGAGNVERCNYYGWLKAQLQRRFKQDEVAVNLRNMPDPVTARESMWLPFMEKQLGCGPTSIICGHSSGAAAAMRFAESHPVAGLVLVGAYSSDLGDSTERASGYFSRPWQWDRIKANSGFIVQFASQDDPFLPWGEQHGVAKALSADLREYEDMGHFQDEEQPDILEVLEIHIKKLLFEAAGKQRTEAEAEGDQGSS